MNAEWSFYVVATLLAFLLSDMWRWGSVLLSRNFREDDEVVIFARMVATAVLAGVVARLLFMPPAELADIPLYVRLLAMVGGDECVRSTRQINLCGHPCGQGALILLGFLTR